MKVEAAERGRGRYWFYPVLAMVAVLVSAAATACVYLSSEEATKRAGDNGAIPHFL